MKEKVIEISTDEIRYLLQGTIYWQDIQEKEKLRVRSSVIPQEQGEPFIKKAKQAQDIEIENVERFELNRILLGDNKEIGTYYLEGKSVVFLLSTMGLLTITIWIYFVFAG